MTTDTALGVTKLVVQDGIPLDKIPFVDDPTIRFDDNESVEMPFRYVKDQQTGEPILPDGMRELLRLVFTVTTRLVMLNSVSNRTETIWTRALMPWTRMTSRAFESNSSQEMARAMNKSSSVNVFRVIYIFSATSRTATLFSCTWPPR